MNTSFERVKKSKQEWLTPPAIIKALGSFDLDPCSPTNRPWDTAKQHFTRKDNGLKQVWKGRVWCNPPYDNAAEWLEKCAKHGNAIALIFARTETNAFFEHIWQKANAVLFIKGRLAFYHVNGKQGESAGSPSVLVAYGKANANFLEKCKIEGKYLKIR
ncbi:MAG: hypothetical protein RLZZ175_2770 [Bacteroidota bacterium]|jgi:hypothetical protein